MVELTKIIVGIFTAIGVLAVTAFLLYLIASALKRYTPPQEPIYPDDQYMNKIGGPCPSGWIHIGKQLSNDGSTMVDLCHNRFDVPVCDPDQCYHSSDKSRKIAAFPAIDDWKQFLKGDVYHSTRCDWVRKCGPPSDTKEGKGCSNAPPASWIGLDDKC